MLNSINHLLATIFLLCIGFSLAAKERLLVFYQAEQDYVFAAQTLPTLEVFAEKEELELVITNQLSQGLPEEITTTPAIVFQNPVGTAIYSGRYTEFSSIRNFIRIARISKQSPLPLEKEAVWLKTCGRTQIALALKITVPSGSLPAGFSVADLETKIKEGLSNGLNTYSWLDQAALKRTDRLFYLDIHPYINAEGQLYLSTAIFSSFSCIDPIQEKFETPINGPLGEAGILSQLIGQQTSNFIAATMADSKIGDAYTPIPLSIPNASFTDLGYPNPIASTAARSSISFPDTPLPKRWRMVGPVNPKTPLIQFHFSAPLERYAGEVRKASGEIQLDDQGQIKSGDFKVEVKSLTMGMADFDAKVLKSYLKAKKHPESRFRFKEVRLREALVWGQNGNASIIGDFELLGKTREVSMNAILVPSINAKSQPILIVQGDFQLNITDLFGIKGPDGPAPAKKTLVFNLSFLMEAVG
ncbi:MAG: hypothetical protein Sapg2KO_11990 [Saprospiraceae bacterium]